MLNFRNTNILFAAMLLMLLVLNHFYVIPSFIYFILLLIYSFILFYGSYFIQSNFYIKTICSAQTTKKEIAISFDDGPAANYTQEILQVLKNENIKATFFCIGNCIAGNEKIFRQINEEGHIIGNHSYSHHFWFDLFSSKKMLNDMALMNEITKETIGLTPKLFRPPYGVTNPNLKNAIVKGNYIPIGWNIRSMDTVINNEEKLLNKISSAIKPGAIILFHDTSKTTLAVLPAFISYVKTNGYEIMRLDKMLNLNPYA
jgi:peptidoglycan/xylan/chitin deacetylase (PgdA/CDA1 family)